MICHLSIKDFALIDSLNVSFHDGLNIITGETGAGKSIIFEAIHLALGSRADTTFIRKGKNKSVIQLIIYIENQEIVNFLIEHGIEIDHEDLVITREIHASGKSICKINDTLTTVSLLNKVCRKMVDIHGQYDHQSLLNPENHLNLLDLYDADHLSDLKGKVNDSYKIYSNISKQLNHLLNTKEESQRKQDFLKYEHSEIASAKLTVGEDESLKQSLNILENSEKIYQNLSSVYDITYSHSEAVVNQLGKAASFMGDISLLDDQLKNYQSILYDALYQLEDLSTEIRQYREGIQFSPNQINDIQERLELINDLKRKYGNSIEKILEYQSKIENELNEIENSDEIIEKLQKEKITAENTLKEQCLILSNHRKKIALELETKIRTELEALNFNNAEFKINFDTYKDTLGHISYSEQGMDLIEFLISTNKGEPLKPLSKIASGGEISRIMLAFKRIIGQYDNISTMIFDEIDTGISGSTASIVGKKLAQIALNHQVICITHLPQIAAMGCHHYRIEKQTKQSNTLTSVKELDDTETIEEISRLLGSDNISKAAIQNAQDILDQAKKFKAGFN
ncbi:MAG: DNA repair protein RecN [Clostridia bacterium]|nr:DNA repair protein RecN [Clostridia bacterium]